MDSELPFAGATSFETEESTCGNQWMCGKHISSMYSFFAIYLLLLPIIVSYYTEGCILRVHCIVFSPLSTEDFPFVQCNPALWQVVCYAPSKWAMERYSNSLAGFESFFSKPLPSFFYLFFWIDLTGEYLADRSVAYLLTDSVSCGLCLVAWASVSLKHSWLIVYSIPVRW